MLSTVRLLSTAVLSAGIGLCAVAMTPVQAAAGACIFVSTDWAGPGTAPDCLDSTCNGGVCCQICNQIEP